MISYEPLWQTMKETNTTTYTLQKNNISSSTIRRMKAGDSVSTQTIDNLCNLLHVPMDKVIAYIPDSHL